MTYFYHHLRKTHQHACILHIQHASILQSSYKFLLIAEDNNRKSTTADFFVTLNPRPRPVNHRITFYTKYNLNLDRDSLVSQFAKLLNSALEGESKVTHPPGRYTIVKIEEANSRLTVTWFDNSLGSKTTCDRRQLGEWGEKMIGRSFDKISDQRLNPKQSFKKKFQPSFIIKSIKISFSGPCLEEESQTIKEPAVLWPSTTPKIRTISTSTKKPQFSASTSSTGESGLLTRTTTTKTASPIKTTTTTFTTIISTTKITRTTTQRPTIATTMLTTTSTTPEPTVFVMESVEGKLSMKNAEALFLRDTFAPGSSTLKLEAAYGSLPQWLYIDQEKWNIIVLPSDPYLTSLKVVNSTHREWQGEMYAEVEKGKTSRRIPVTIFVALQPSNDNWQSKVTHMFRMRIVNFNIKVRGLRYF